MSNPAAFDRLAHYPIDFHYEKMLQEDYERGVFEPRGKKPTKVVW
jgi:hypothetical protein